jgi:hypothetical protein
MDVVLGEEQDRLKAMINELKNRKGRHTKADIKLRAILEQQLEARKIVNNAGVLDEFARLLDKKPVNQYALDAIQARDPRMAGARFENTPSAASRPMFNPEVQRDMLRQFAGQPVVNADYDNAGRLRARVAAQYADVPTMSARPFDYTAPQVSANYFQQPPPIPEEFPPIIKKDPISVTGTTAGDKKLNEAIKADEKSAKAGVAADKATGGLWSKIKSVKPMGFVKGVGAVSGGSAVGDALARAISPDQYDDVAGTIGSIAGGIGGGLLTATPYVGTGLALLGAGNLAMNLFGDNEVPPTNTAPSLESLANVTDVKPIDKLGEIMQALAAANLDVANMRGDTKQRMINRGNQAADIDPSLLR